MSSIKILEKDLTSSGGSLLDLDVVFVPGFVALYPDTPTKDTEDAWGTVTAKVTKDDLTKDFPGAYVPTLCKTIAEFEASFGKCPAKLTVTNNGKGTTTIDDKSYIYAKNLLQLGLPVMYMAINELNADDDTMVEGTMETALTSMYTTNDNVNLEDRGEYSFKYLTSGGYPSFQVGTLKSNTIATNMGTLASLRGDCVALIDHPDNVDMTLSGDDSYFKLFQDAFKDDTNAAYCAAFTPWININYTTYTYVGDKKTVASNFTSMPPSFAYLSALANSMKTNASWLAVAGASRGQIPNLYSEKPLNINKILTNAVAENTYQQRNAVSINAITNIKPFGNRIWGNRTLKNNANEGNLTATSFLNIRNMISDVKKVVYSACKRYTFEQNNDVLWVNFKAAVEPTLNKMKTGAGLSGYKIIQGTTTEKAKLVATIKLYPLYAVEDFEITVEMLDDEVKVS